MVSFVLWFAAILLSTATAQDCLDQNPNCLAWQKMGFCVPTNQYFNYMLTNCLKSCGLCATPRPSCSDKNAWCSSYKDFCQHPDYIDYVKIECKQTCNYCHITTAPPPTTQPTQPYTGPAGRGLQGNCGHKGPGHTRIVGGTNAKPGDWPWQVNIDYKYNTANPGAHCGGTLINDEWVLSAAHCFKDDPVKERYWLKLGEHDIHSKNTWEQRYEIAELILHPSYDDIKNHDYDFALLRLNRSATFNDRVRPACIPGHNTSFPIGTECYISGWGMTDEHDPKGPAILQQAMVPLVSKSTCKQAFTHLAYPLTSRMICAGFDYKPIDSCQGDSGGPLVCKKGVNGKDVWYLWGMVSWGTGCARNGTYGVYARSTSVTEWITQKAFS